VLPQKPTTTADEEVTTFLQLEEEAKQYATPGRECPVPKPTGIIGNLLGFSKGLDAQGERRQVDVGGQPGQ
jgi:cytochrome c oxidase assembly factor 2